MISSIRISGGEGHHGLEDIQLQIQLIDRVSNGEELRDGEGQL